MDIQDPRITIVKSEQRIASCNSCFAHNYSTGNVADVGTQVDTLYELNIGSMMVVLCEDCMHHLFRLIENTLSEVK